MTSSSQPFPLSFAQQRLWLLDRLVPDSPLYNIITAYELQGVVDVAALVASFQCILDRHEILRGVFTEVKGEPVQQINPSAPPSLAQVDLSGLPASGRDREADAILQAEGRRPFDLRRGPLLRVLLVYLGDQSYRLAITVHHIVSDGWSCGILHRELSELYRCARLGAVAHLAELPIQYIDFAVWQREWLRGEVLERQLSYWRESLRGVPPVLPLPTDRPRSLIQSHLGATYRFTIPAAVTTKLKGLIRKQATTLFTAALACFYVLLHRYTNQEDVAVGAPVANRNRLEIENLIGFFVNMLVLRSRLSGNLPFGSLLHQLQGLVLDAFSRQDLPFEKLIEELHPERTLSHSPLFQVVISQNTPPKPLTLPGLQVRPLEFNMGTAKFDITFGIEDADEHLNGTFEYSSDLFDPATVKRMASHLVRIFEQVSLSPELQIDELPLLDESELAQAVREWNDTARDYPTEKPLICLFEEQVDRTPEAVAVITNHGQWSYRELDWQATRLSRLLREYGVGPDVPVGVFMRRSFEMMVAITGILKAGGAYLGLDLLSPRERLAWVLEDSGVPVILSEESLLDKLPPTSKIVFCLDRDRELLQRYSDQRLEVKAAPESLHCLVYTSGSTGLPKGTLATVRNYLNLALWYCEYSHHGPHSRSLLATGINWDASFRNYFTTLLAGGATVLSDDGSYDPQTLLQTISRHKVTVATTPMSLIYPVIEAARAQDFQGLSSFEYLHQGGEAVVSSKLRDWLHSPNCHCTVTNIYGLTETSDVSTGGRLELEEIDRLETTSIGRPVQNHRVYILSRYGQPQPIGVVGEIYIGGLDAMTRGYLNRPELTAEKFVPDPFGCGDRFYKTGDLGRWLGDGRLEYAGRTDYQVKIRGMRIELGEVEEQLRRHPSVQEVVALVRDLGADDKRLVAYVLPRPGQQPSAVELSSFLRARVPDFLVPSAIVLLDKMPLGASGKIDRKALPEPEWGKAVRERPYIAPQTPEEVRLAQLFAELLKVDQVGLGDHFFELGGHSLLALQLISRIRDSFRVEIALQQLFQAPTVGELVGVITELGATKEAGHHSGPIRRVVRRRELWESVVVELKQSGSQAPIFCVHPAMGNVITYAELARALPDDQPFYGLQSPEPRDMATPFERLEEMAAVYCEAVRRVLPDGPCVLAGWSQGGAVAFEMARQLESERSGTVVLLVLLDPTLPGLFEQAGDNAMTLALFARDIGLQGGGRRLELTLEELRELDSEDDQWSYFLLKARIAKALSEGLDGDVLRSLYQVFKMNVRAFQAYTPKSYGGPVAIFVPRESLEGVHKRWSTHLTDIRDISAVAGDHVTFLRPPHVSELARRWSAVYAAVAGSPPHQILRRESTGGATVLIPER